MFTYTFIAFCEKNARPPHSLDLQALLDLNALNYHVGMVLRWNSIRELHTKADQH